MAKIPYLAPISVCMEIVIESGVLSVSNTATIPDLVEGTVPDDLWD